MLAVVALGEFVECPRRCVGDDAASDAGKQYLSTITVFGIELGVLQVERRDLSQGKSLRRWFYNSVLDAFASRTLALTRDTARRAAGLHIPDPRPERDAYVAATALVHGLTVATRNTVDFESMGVAVFNPWVPDIGQLQESAVAGPWRRRCNRWWPHRRLLFILLSKRTGDSMRSDSMAARSAGSVPHAVSSPATTRIALHLAGSVAGAITPRYEGGDRTRGRSGGASTRDVFGFVGRLGHRDRDTAIAASIERHTQLGDPR